ncbi:MAG: LCP family protein [Anaerolineales bacterium]|nr:LCP family protein [Anaerolineales bacterium]
MRNNRGSQRGRQTAAQPNYTVYPTPTYTPRVTYYPPVGARRRANRIGQFLWGYCLGLAGGAFGLALLAAALIFAFPPGRTNILLLGVDRRPDETTYIVRTDTMILTTVYPQERYVGMLSIPRDLYVKLPQGYQGRINSAHVFAEVDQAGSGPAAAMEVVRSNFGVNVDGFVRVDLIGFVRIVDAMGGIDLDVPNALIDYEYPTYDYGTRVVEFAAGEQHMDGEAALAYARIRHGSSDFQRAERQQLVIAAMITRLMQPSAWVLLPQIIAAVQEAVTTDLTLPELARLTPTLLLVGPNDIDRRVIQDEMVQPYTTEGGGSVQLPVWEAINPVLLEMFGQ